MSTNYCAAEDVERLFSTAGVLAFSDPDQDGTEDTGVLDDCIEQASDEITLLIHDRYEESALAANRMVTRWATTLATYFLCQRRGNPVPETLQTEFTRIIKLLTQIGQGLQNIPGVPLRCDLRPTWSNLTADRRYRRSKTRVTRTNSSDPPTRLTQDSVDSYPMPEY